MKNAIILVSLVGFISIGCSCKHEWQAADCSAPSSCIKCGEVSGSPIPHSVHVQTIVDIINAERTSTEVCLSCGKVISTRTSSVERLYDGQKFIFTPEELCYRLDSILSENYNMHASGPVSINALGDCVYYGIYNEDWKLIGGIICLDENKIVCMEADHSDVYSVIIMSLSMSQEGLDMVSAGIKALVPTFSLNDSDSTLRKLAQSGIVQNGLSLYIMDNGDTAFSLYAYPNN